MFCFLCLFFVPFCVCLVLSYLLSFCACVCIVLLIVCLFVCLFVFDIKTAYNAAPYDVIIYSVEGQEENAFPTYTRTCSTSSLCIPPQGKFSSTPYILITAEHTAVNLKHDAATIWIEDANPSTFKICLRELQNFDGMHKKIMVVTRNFVS